MEVGQSSPSSKQAEPTCSSHASPDEHLGRKHIYSTLASWGNIHHFPLKHSSAGIYRLMRAIFFLSMSGGGAADDYRLWERGQPLRHGRSLLWGEVSNDSRSCPSQMDRHATLTEVGGGLQSKDKLWVFMRFASSYFWLEARHDVHSSGDQTIVSE